ncbi:MAG: tRNA lysidine(34) synthetase TilS [Clostridiales bacterium]|nr:tRNA lysidine(34) synthetase TilS [Clostridiales bacterium]
MPMDEQIENTVETVLRRANLLRSGATLLVALSGGADSVVLLRAVCALRPENGLNVTAAHVEHGLRGARALADAHFCERLCAELGVPLSLDHADLPGDMRAPGAETRAREARYRLLLSRARACRADALLLAHHQDDQAETVLARLIRGGGAQGLAGMREISRMEGVTLARPLLSLPKQALLKALGGLPYCEDETNAEPCCQRNRLRAEVLPLLAAENPRAAAHIARSAALLAMDEDCLQAQAEALLTVARVDRPPYYYVRRATLRAAPAAVAVRALRAFVLMGAARLQRADAPTSAGPPPSVTDASALA